MGVVKVRLLLEANLVKRQKVKWGGLMSKLEVNTWKQSVPITFKKFG